MWKQLLWKDQRKKNYSMKISLLNANWPLSITLQLDFFFFPFFGVSSAFNTRSFVCRPAFFNILSKFIFFFLTFLLLKPFQIIHFAPKFTSFYHLGLRSVRVSPMLKWSPSSRTSWIFARLTTSVTGSKTKTGASS